ncbi:MAG: RNA methyltransferase [Prevotellaceae bacterium]|nr:RNA methyltransferase [Candidatus Faecinaster equi]
MRKLNVIELNRLSVEQFKQTEKNHLVIVLDNIRSMYNVGSVFRTADAFKIEKIILCGITAQPPMVEIHKTALGAEDSVEWEYIKDTLEAVEQLKNKGYETLAVEQVEQSIKLQEWNVNPQKKYALILGNEVMGVRQDVVDICDNTLEIPQFGTKHSLNVSCTASIVMWEYLKQIL